MLVRYSTVQLYQISPTSSSNIGKVFGVSRFTRFSLEMSQILGGQMKGYYFVKKINWIPLTEIQGKQYHNMAPLFDGTG